MNRLCIAAATVAFARSALAADLPTDIPSLAPPPAPAAACVGVADFFSSKCTLSAYGVTVYGTVDLGAAWQSHGTPFNNVYVTGLEYLVSKNGNKPLWSTAPSGLSQSNIGIKGLEPLAYGTSFVFDLEAGFDPYSFQLSNGPRSQVENDGIPLGRQSSNGDSSRAGQFYNALGYAGLTSPTYGTLTAGRQNSLTLDGVIAYDPQGASYAFSPIGYSGVTAGVGDTEDARYTTSLKYKVAAGPLRAAALYQFGDYASGNASTGAYQGELGADFPVGAGKISLDAIYSYVENAVSTASLSVAQNLKFPGQLAATLSNDSSEMALGKYALGPATAFAGYEHILFENPSRSRDSFLNIGGYTVESANLSVTAYDIHRNLHIFWGGLKYSVTKDVDLTGAYYQYVQDNYNKHSCSNGSSASCSGELHAISFVADWRVLPKLDAYSGVMFSEVDNGLANGYIHHVSADPMVGVRFRF